MKKNNKEVQIMGIKLIFLKSITIVSSFALTLI